MSLEKRLKTKGQAALEYFILFAIIAGITLLSLTTFLPAVKNSAETVFQKGADAIINEAPDSLLTYD